MKKLLLVILVLNLWNVPMPVQAQENGAGLLFGASNYTGDLQAAEYTFFESHPVFSFMYWRELNGHFNLRGGLSLAQISGDDRYNPVENVRIRNLSFHSNITEFQVGVEYNLFNMDIHRFSPYAFISLALFHFNPTAVDTNGRRVALKPLSTEGEGLPEYPGQHPYSLTQVDIPIGGGLHYAVTNNMTLGAEIGLRVTFTDYLDDASTIYVDKNILLAAKGGEAVELAFRTNELPGYQSSPYPAAGTPRASSKYNDYYYFSQLSITYWFSSGNGHIHSDHGSGLDKAEKAVQCPPDPKNK